MKAGGFRRLNMSQLSWEEEVLAQMAIPLPHTMVLVAADQSARHV